MDKKKRVGYIAAVLSSETIERIDFWVKKNIPKESLFFANINGTLEGGNVVDKAHLTIFFGIDDSATNNQKIQALINKIILSDLIVKGINSFNTPNFPCKILYLVIDDSSGALKEAHDHFSVLPHFTDLQESKFIPHVTLAYVKNDFNEGQLSYMGKLTVQSVVYKIKS